jgi:hypothetical protein
MNEARKATCTDSTPAATPVSNISLLASISPYGTAGPDVDYYSASAVPGSIVEVYASANNDFLRPLEPNSMRPVIEFVGANGTGYQTCGYTDLIPGLYPNRKG